MDGRRFDALARGVGGAPTRRGVLGALVGMLAGGGALAADAQRRRAKDDDPKAAGKRRNRKRCIPECTGNSNCVRGTCVCEQARCGAACCDAGQVCQRGRCVGQGTVFCHEFGEACGDGARCCDGLRCGSGYGGGPVACHAVAGGECMGNEECLYGFHCENGACVSDPPPPTPTPVPTPPMSANAQAQAPLGAGQGTNGDQFQLPTGVALSADGLTLYVADQDNHRIARWTRANAGAAWTAQAPLGAGAGANDDQFFFPSGVAVSADGLALYVADAQNNRIARWTRANAGAAWAAQAPLGAGFGANDDQFHLPGGVAVSADGLALYVADAQNNRIARWRRADTAAAWQAQAPLGSDRGTSDDKFNFPFGVAVSADGMALYVGDQNNHRIARWTRANAGAAWVAQAPLGAGYGTNDDQFHAPVGVALSADGLALHVADQNNHRIARWTRANAEAAWAAQAPLGAGQGSSGDQFQYPAGVAVSADGLALYVGDAQNHRIAVWRYA